MNTLTSMQVFLVTLWFSQVHGTVVDTQFSSHLDVSEQNTNITLGDKLVRLASPPIEKSPISKTWYIHAVENKLIGVDFYYFNVKYSTNCKSGGLAIYLGVTTSSPMYLDQNLCGGNDVRSFISTTSDLVMEYWNDVEQPNEGFGVTLSTYAPCSNSEYRCWDGTCIQSSLKCDGKSDCGDKSDEVECEEETSWYGECGKQSVPPKEIVYPKDELLLERIVGGNEATAGSWPWQVQLTIAKNDLIYLCGGTVISDQWVLTAAHCIEGSASNQLLVRAGINDITHEQDPNEQTSTVTHVYPHESYVSSEWGFDIALLKLDKNLSFTNFVRPVCLKPNSTSWNPSDETQCFATGWGTTVSGGSTSSILREVSLEPHDNDFCTPFYNDLLKETQPNTPNEEIMATEMPASILCAGPWPADNADTCQGDSGGPLVCFDGSTWYQIGITSMGLGCGSMPGFYASVPELFPWIEKTTSRNFSNSPNLSPSLIAAWTASVLAISKLWIL